MAFLRAAGAGAVMAALVCSPICGCAARGTKAAVARIDEPGTAALHAAAVGRRVPSGRTEQSELADAGPTSTADFGSPPASNGPAVAAGPSDPAPRARKTEVALASHLDSGEPAGEPSAPESDAAPAPQPFSGQIELSLEGLLAAVEERNPTLQAALAAWAAAAERHPQVIALEDPLFQSMFAPGSFPSSSNVQSSYYLGIAQKIPWPGKRALRGQIAAAEANAAGFDSEEVRLRLAEAARIAFFDYYLVRRELALNAANIDALSGFRRTALEKYEKSLVPAQDYLQADVELARLESRQIELEQNDRIAVARINTLLRRAPDEPLPPPPAELRVADGLLAADTLRQMAIEHRPDLAAKAARIEAEQASVALACKEFYPDFEFMGRYDQFWTDVEQRPQIGMNVNIPLNQSRRKAAVREAMFRLRKMQAEYEQEVDNVRNDVQAALARVEGSRRTVRLYDSKILPVARLNVESADAGYTAQTVDFLRLIEAQRELIDLQEKHQQAIADYHRRAAELERVVGAPLAEGPQGAR